MPKLGPAQIRLVFIPSPQAPEKPGLKSLTSISAAPFTQPETGASTSSGADKVADLAQEKLAMIERTQWTGSSLQRGSVALLPRIPFGDAVKLASLVGAGRITWPEVNAALDAMMKLAISDRRNRHRMPQNWQRSDKAWADHDEWDEARRAGESEIWGRYDAKCDALFADDPSPIDRGPRALEQLFSRERTLDRLRSIRDAELAELDARLGPQPPRPAASAIDLNPDRAATLKSQLTSFEADAMHKLDATHFIASADMTRMIDDLASEIASNDGKRTA